MTETKAFPTADVLSLITGRLLSDEGIGAMQTILSWMTGEDVYTHQIPRIADEAKAVLIGLQPNLLQASEEAGDITGGNWRDWLARWEARYGKAIIVPKFNADQHERIDPLSELAERFRPDQIIILNGNETE